MFLLVEAPEKGEDFQSITDDYQKHIIPGHYIFRMHSGKGTYENAGITHWQHPSFFAYFPAGASFESILADLYASSVTNPGFNVRLIPYPANGPTSAH